MDLTTRYLGLTLKSPIVAGAGPLTGKVANIRQLEDLGAGAVVLPSLFEEQIELGKFDGGAARCQATTRKGKPCQRTPLPERDYCPSHQHLDAGRAPAASRVAA